MTSIAQILAHSLNKYPGQSKYFPGSYDTFSIHGYPDWFFTISQVLCCVDHFEAGRATGQELKFASWREQTVLTCLLVLDRLQRILGAWLNEVHAPYDHTAKGCWTNACLPWEHSPSGIDLDVWSASAAVSVSLPFGLQVIETELARLQLCAVKVCFLHLGCLAKCVCHSPIMITVKSWKNREQSWWLRLADESAFLYLCNGHF